MKRNTRRVIYLVGIVFLLFQIQFQFIQRIWNKVESAWNEASIRRVQYLAQVENLEYQNYWLGVGVIQYPSDLITYAELAVKLRPEIVIETGTNYGGLALYFASLLERINPGGLVITIDLNRDRWDGTIAAGKIPDDLRKRIVFLEGDSVSERVTDQVAKYADGRKGLVILDSLHSKDHVLKELKLYSEFVAVGNYMIVNDTHLEIMGIMDAGSGRGPLTAVKEFLKTTSDFEIDGDLPRAYLSCAPSGFLKRIR